jgi:hypothetical protein
VEIVIDITNIICIANKTAMDGIGQNFITTYGLSSPYN